LLTGLGTRVVGFWLGVEGEQQRLVVRARHAVHLSRVALNFIHERALVLGASFGPAVAANDPVHDRSSEV
jgi:hypothetical protein